MEFSWLGFIVGFLSGVILSFMVAKMTDFLRFITMAKYQASIKGKEGEKLNELTSKFKEGFGAAGPGDKDRETK